jgi:hypothetical protein
MNEGLSNNNHVSKLVKSIGILILRFMVYLGSPICFCEAGHDEPGEYAFYLVDVSSLPWGVSLKHLRDPRLVALLEMCVRRRIEVEGRGKVRYIVDLRNELELELEQAA